MARFVLKFRKGEEVRWLGHLDLLRCIERVLRRADVPVAYTQGFNPRPKMSIASALGLGVTSSEEILTLEMARDIGTEDLARRLNSQMPPGLEIMGAELMPEGAKKSVQISGSEFQVTLRHDPDVSREILSNAVTNLLEQKEISAVREKKEKNKPVNLRPGIESIEITDSSTLVMRIRQAEGFTPKPAEIVEALSACVPGLEVERVHRVKMY